MKKQKVIIVALSLSLGLCGMHGAALAQETQEDLTATNGDAAALGTGNASSAPGTVTRDGVSGMSLLGPDGTYRVTERLATDRERPGQHRCGDRARPLRNATPRWPRRRPRQSPTDTDGDGVADSDEIDLYGTDPENWDTDGDGLSDSEELFVAGTDPFVWDTNGDGVSDGGIGRPRARPCRDRASRRG